MAEGVLLEVVSLVYGHLLLVKLYQENALFLSLVKRVILPREWRRLELPIVSTDWVRKRIVCQHAVVLNEIVSDRSYSTVYIEQRTILSDELVSCDRIAIDVERRILDLTIIFKDTRFVL